MADGEARKRAGGSIFLASVMMILASAAAIFIGLVGFGLYLPNMMTFARAFNAEDTQPLLIAIFLFLSAGPVAAGIGLVAGWVLFFAGRRGAAWRAALYPGVAWAVLVIAYIWAVGRFCDDQFTCGL
mgnify:FL=1